MLETKHIIIVYVNILKSEQYWEMEGVMSKKGEGVGVERGEEVV